MRYRLRTLLIVLAWSATLEAATADAEVPLTHDEVRLAIRTFLATSSDAKDIGFIRFSGEGIEKKPVVTFPDTDYVRLGPWQVNVVTHDALLFSRVALLEGTVVRTTGGLSIKINRIIWHRR
jgi:hypothetical protein